MNTRIVTILIWLILFSEASNAGDFSISISPKSATIRRGETANFHITVLADSSMTSAITFSLVDHHNLGTYWSYFSTNPVNWPYDRGEDLMVGNGNAVNGAKLKVVVKAQSLSFLALDTCEVTIADSATWLTYMSGFDIYRMYMTKEGSLWIDRNGYSYIGRFDGYGWSSYNRSLGSVAAMGDSVLLVDSDELYEVRGDVWTARPTWRNRGVRALISGRDGRIYGFGLDSIYAFQDSVWHGVLPFDQNYVPYRVLFDGHARAWIVGWSWVGFWNGSGWTILNAGNSNLPAGQIFSSDCDPDGSMWFGMYGTVSKYTGHDFLTYSTPDQHTVYAIAFDSTGRLWCGTSDVSISNVNVFDFVTWRVYNSSNSPIPNSAIRSIVTDLHGNIMIASGSGLFVKTKESSYSDVSRGTALPLEMTLYQNYPNPFNPSTTIEYELPRASHVTLNVYDVLGREVSVLVNERREAGVHEVKFDGSNLASGVYFYRLQAGTYVQTRKLLLMKELLSEDWSNKRLGHRCSGLFCFIISPRQELDQHVENIGPKATVY